MTTAKAIKILMKKYEESRGEWIKNFGNDTGFDAWFTHKFLERMDKMQREEEGK